MANTVHSRPELGPGPGPVSGHDGPYPPYVEVADLSVLAEWIDYNDHMNVAYYGVAFDQASDVMLSEYLGVGVEHLEATGHGPYVLQTHQHYLAEMTVNEPFSIRFRLIDHDTKRLHLFGELVSRAGGHLCATQEVLVMNVDHATKRGARYPDWAIRRFAQMLADHAGTKTPVQIGAKLGIRHKG